MVKLNRRLRKYFAILLSCALFVGNIATVCAEELVNDRKTDEEIEEQEESVLSEAEDSVDETEMISDSDEPDVSEQQNESANEETSEDTEDSEEEEFDAADDISSVESAKEGMNVAPNGVWRYYRNGAIDYGYTGMACNQYGWWYFTNGTLNLSYTGMACNEYGWFYYENGQLNWNYTGMACNEYGWWYITNGVLDLTYTGMACNENGWFYYENGQINWHYTGMACNEYGWWYYYNGGIAWGYTGMACNEYGWWYFTNGVLDLTYTGMGWNEYGWWYYSNGRLDLSYTGMACNQYGWYYMENGYLNDHYTGIAHNDYGYWLFSNGDIAYVYSGEYTDSNGQVYEVTNGSAVPKYMGKVDVSNVKDSVFLGVFMNSTADSSDTLYVSFNGYDFKKIGTAYEDATPSSTSSDETVDSAKIRSARGNNSSIVENTLHDPSILYANGYFWLLSGYTSGGKFYPMLGYSNDLTNWSYPASGDNWTGLTPTVSPYAKDGTRSNTNFDVAAPDFMVDDDGSIWVVACLGYYGSFHGEGSNADKLSPYLVHITSAKAGTTDLTTAFNRGINPTITYGKLVPINLPEENDNRIDASLYKENGKYYLVIKRDGVTNEIWATDNLNNCQNKNSWTKVCNNIITGYEGPSVTKFGNYYFCYTDKLADYPAGASDGTTGIFVATSSSLSGQWSANQRITTKDVNGKNISTRHGTVITISKSKNAAAYNLIMQKYKNAGY